MARNQLRRNPFIEARPALQFAVQFSQADLSSMSQQKLTAYERRLQAFINREKRLSEHRDGELARLAPDGKLLTALCAFQERTRELLTALAKIDGPTLGD